MRRIFSQAFGSGTHDPAAIPESMDLVRNVHKAHHVLDAAHDEYLKPYNLTTAKFRLLMWLLACEKVGYDDGLLPSELSRFQGISPNTVSSLLSGLQEQGLIQRAKHSTDHRKQIITISDAGRDLFNQISTRYLDYMHATLSGLSHEEREILITLLKKMVVSIQSATEAEHHNAHPVSAPPTE